MLYMISKIRDGKDLLHNLTTTMVKNVSLPVGGSEPFTAFLAGIVHIVYQAPTSCCLLLLSFIIFWVSPFPVVKGSLQTPSPTCFMLYWAHWLYPSFKAGSAGGCGEPWPPHSQRWFLLPAAGLGCSSTRPWLMTGLTLAPQTWKFFTSFCCLCHSHLPI